MDDLSAIGASLSPWMTRALPMLAREHIICICTVIGSMLTGQHSAYGWQTSAREGGRTLRALERRGLASRQHIQPGEKIFPWALTDRGRRLAAHLAASATAASPEAGHAP
jgi:hypothetical protein